MSEQRDKVWQALVEFVACVRKQPRDATASLLADEGTERVCEAITGDRDADPWAVGTWAHVVVECVVCGECGFTYDADHDDVDRPRFHSCPVCEALEPAEETT